MTPPLACTVRHCGLLLDRQGRVYRCTRGHTYDVAREGYVNVLQPQDRRSRQAGDAPAALAARQRLLDAGVGRVLLDTLAARAADGLHTAAVAVDLGCGSGEMLAAVRDRVAVIGMGLDLSTTAVSMAARRFPHLLWVAANADRRLPLLDRTVDLILSVHARRNPAECARVLAPGGRVWVAVPAADDLGELRAAALGEAVARERVEALRAEFAPHLALVQQFDLRERRRLEPAQLTDLMQGTYRAGRRRAAESTAALGALDVTLASDVLVFARG